MKLKAFLPEAWTQFRASFRKFVKKTFVGTRAEWDLLSASEKTQYDLADFTDDTASGVPIISDTVAEGDMNAVTSNAVFNFKHNAIPLDIEVVEVSNNYVTLDIKMGNASKLIDKIIAGEFILLTFDIDTNKSGGEHGNTRGAVILECNNVTSEGIGVTETVNYELGVTGDYGTKGPNTQYSSYRIQIIGTSLYAGHAFVTVL